MWTFLLRAILLYFFELRDWRYFKLNGLSIKMFNVY